ncbi:MAG TPA: tetratricopeptide repeat protein [Polyangium sp.]|nr:tetratricopeptide repeat protein [Polyangium sp.]
MRGRRNQAWSLVLGLVLGICPGQTVDAWAQAKKGADKKQPVKANDPEYAEFEKHFTAGQTAAKANRWDAARQEFLQAFDLKPDHAATVALLAQAEMATGRHREAAEHLEIFLDYAVGIGPEDRKTAEELLVEAQSKLAIVTVKVDKPGAKVTVDGRVLGTSPMADPVLVDAGQGRRFEAETPDGWRTKMVVDLEPRTTPTVDMILKAPPTKIVKVGQPWRTPLLFTGIGLSVVGIGTGVGFFVAGSAKNKAAKDLVEEIKFNRNMNEKLCPPTSSDAKCDELATLQTQSNTFGTIAIAGFAVGGVAAIGTAVLAITAPKQTSAPKKNAFMVLPSPGGVWVTGTF